MCASESDEGRHNGARWRLHFARYFRFHQGAFPVLDGWRGCIEANVFKRSGTKSDWRCAADENRADGENGRNIRLEVHGYWPRTTEGQGGNAGEGRLDAGLAVDVGRARVCLGRFAGGGGPLNKVDRFRESFESTFQPSDRENAWRTTYHPSEGTESRWARTASCGNPDFGLPVHIPTNISVPSLDLAGSRPLAVASPVRP